MKPSRRSLTAFFILLLPFGLARAANPDAVQALSVYPAQIRQAVLETLKYPQTLVALGSIREKTVAAVRQLLSSLPKATQEAAAQLLPNTGLIRAMAAEGQKDPKALDAVLKNYPSQTQAAARKILAENYEVVKQLDTLGNQAYAQFESAIQSLPSSGQVAFRTLVQHREILKILYNELGLEAPPKDLDSRIQSLAARLSAVPASTKSEWGAAPGDDPAAVASLKKAEESMDRKLDYQMNVDPYPKGAVQANVNFNPYPYYNPYAGGFYVPYFFGFGPTW